MIKFFARIARFKKTVKGAISSVADFVPMMWEQWEEGDIFDPQKRILSHVWDMVHAMVQHHDLLEVTIIEAGTNTGFEWKSPAQIFGVLEGFFHRFADNPALSPAVVTVRRGADSRWQICVATPKGQGWDDSAVRMWNNYITDNSYTTQSDVFHARKMMFTDAIDAARLMCRNFKEIASGSYYHTHRLIVPEVGYEFIDATDIYEAYKQLNLGIIPKEVRLNGDKITMLKFNSTDELNN